MNIYVFLVSPISHLESPSGRGKFNQPRDFGIDFLSGPVILTRFRVRARFQPLRKIRLAIQTRARAMGK